MAGVGRRGGSGGYSNNPLLLGVTTGTTAPSNASSACQEGERRACTRESGLVERGFLGLTLPLFLPSSGLGNGAEG